MITVLGWLIFALWLRLSILMIGRPFPTLKQGTQGLSPPTDWPKISVLVPACNEAQDIEANLKSLLASDYPHLEIIAINDRSTDDTGQIMDLLAQTHPHLKVLHIDTLPPGWLGKNNALHTGAKSAQGDYLLMTDGDIFFAPDTLQDVMLYVSAHHLDHFCLFPDFINGQFWENTFICHFSILYFSQLQSWKLGKDPNTYVGVGAFNLVRRSTYEANLGHTPLRLEVLDDVMLGKLMVDKGAKTGALMGSKQLRVRWHIGIKGLLKGLEKNGFAALRFSWLRLVLMTLLSVILFILPYLGLWFFPASKSLGFVGTLVLIHGLYAYFGVRFKQGWHVTLGLPWVVFVGLYIFWNSAWITFKNKGIRWRGTFYALKELKANKYI